MCDISSRRGRMAHDQLARAGFRRTQHMAYRPACGSCSACVPVRVRVEDFQWTKGQRRILKANSDLVATIVPNEATKEQYELFSAYQKGRHGDGEMVQMDYVDYSAMVERSPIPTSLIEYRDAAGALKGTMLVDFQEDGYSAVYSFFDTDDGKRGLGRFMVLDLISKAEKVGFPYIYLGYWVRDCRKMNYKTLYRPVEGLINGEWQDLVTEGE